MKRKTEIKRRSAPGEMRIYCLVFLIIGLVLLGFAVRVILHVVPEDSRVYIPARIEKILKTEDREGKVHRSLEISYEVDGIPYRHVLHHVRPGKRVGDTITIYYEEGDPDRIGVKGGNITLPAFLLFFGGISAAMGVIPGVKYRLFLPEYTGLKEKGQRITAEYAGTFPGISIGNDGTCYSVCCRFDQEKQKYTLFRSRLRFRDSAASLPAKKSPVPVYIDPGKPWRYYVDLNAAIPQAPESSKD
jgi:hypothetical protein